MINYIKYQIKEDDNNIRVDRWLRRKFNKLPQNFFEKKLRKGNIRLNGKIIKSNTKVLFNDVLEIFDFDKKIYSRIENTSKFFIDKTINRKFKSSILYENDNYIIINKWKGIPTQGGTGIHISIDNIIKSLSDEMYLVHRLDKDTSGTLIISKNYKTTRFFSELFREKKIIKIYIAICEGYPKKNKGVIKLDIKKKIPKIRNNIFTLKKNQFSETKYELLDKKNNRSLVIFMPLTGKMHQIRIVAKYLGCSILGDQKYGTLRDIKDKNSKNKLMLHALGIIFKYNDKKCEYFADMDIETTENFNQMGFKIPNKNILKNIIK